MKKLSKLVGVSCQLLSLAVISCSQRPGPERPCPRDVPAFRVELTAPGGLVPAETELSVMFGGSGVERYSVARGNRDNKTVCCTAAQPTDGKLPPVPCDDASSQGAALIALDAGADRGSTAIHCELWTDGAAEVEVNADGYAPLSETLSALIDDDEELEECKTLKTKDVRLVLQMGDAGLGG